MADREILPDHFKAANYDLKLTDLNFEDWTYQGSLTISGDLVKPSTSITLNTLEVKLTKAVIDLEVGKSSQAFETTDFSYDTKKQQATITFKDEIKESPKTKLHITFTGIMNHDMAGFYRSQYKPAVPAAKSVPRDADFHYMLSTQFESCDARRAFPCFDEPNLKATFDFAIEIPDDQVALSNMPVTEEKPTTAGKKLVTFERTPVMSTYLLAWAVGDFEYLEGFTERRYNGRQIPVRVYTTRGLKEHGQWAIQHAPKFIDFYSEKFEIDYPLPKSDILAVHEFTHGAMENWGLVTYRTTAVLMDEKHSESRLRNRIAYVVAHELAHQWFGNLVTMDWWDELWLNEGFATWAGWLATESVHPDWDVWAQFVNEGMESALKLDAIRASHPIQVPVRDALDVNQVFDAISYLKGCSVIRMLANHLTIPVFLKGVAKYLKKHEYGNAKTTALFDALSEVSGQDVNGLMKPWIEQIGHPVLRIGEEPRQISIKQSRFLSTGDAKEEDDTTTWWVPLAIEGRVGKQGIEPLALTKKEDIIRDVNDDFYKINSNATGFYRVNYPPLRLAKLGTQLDRLSTEDKISIAGSAAVLAFSGEGTTPALLSFLKGFSNETHLSVLTQAIDSLATIKGIFGDDEQIKAGLDKFTLAVVDKPLTALGWEFPSGEDFQRSQLRKRLLVAAGLAGHPSVTEEALKRFTAHVNDPEANPLVADTRQAIYRVALKNNPGHAVTFLKHEWQTSPIPEAKELCLQCMGHVSDVAVVNSVLLPFLFGLGPECIPAGDMHILAIGLASNRIARPLLWSHIQANWNAILQKVAGNPIVLDRFVKCSLQAFADFSVLKGIDAFFEGKDTSAFNRTLETVKDNIRGRAAYRERDVEELREWLVSNGYA